MLLFGTCQLDSLLKYLTRDHIMYIINVYAFFLCIFRTAVTPDLSSYQQQQETSPLLTQDHPQLTSGHLVIPTPTYSTNTNTPTTPTSSNSTTSQGAPVDDLNIIPGTASQHTPLLGVPTQPSGVATLSSEDKMLVLQAQVSLIWFIFFVRISYLRILRFICHFCSAYFFIQIWNL